MQAIYPYVLTIHLICAIIFVGFLFFDVVVFNRLRSVLGDDFERLKNAIVSRGVKIYPLAVLGLLLSGGMMMSSWVGSKAGGYFSSPMQQLFMLKVALAFIIFAGVAFSIFNRLSKRPSPNFMKRHFHTLACVLAFAIVILAKAMFYV